MKKFLIFDAGPIISLSMNGLLFILERLKKDFDGAFVITPEVYREVVDRPMQSKEYKLEAIKVKHLIEKGVFTLSKEFVDNSKLLVEKKKILKAANGVLRLEKNNDKVTILHEGEAACLAFAMLCDGEHLLVVDERSTRLLFESPENLRRLVERKVHSPISVHTRLVDSYRDVRFVRSAELVYYAYTKDLIGFGKGKDVLDGLLYALKFHGTTISSDEIEYLKNRG